MKHLSRRAILHLTIAAVATGTLIAGERAVALPGPGDGKALVVATPQGAFALSFRPQQSQATRKKGGGAKRVQKALNAVYSRLLSRGISGALSEPRKTKRVVQRVDRIYQAILGRSLSPSGPRATAVSTTHLAVLAAYATVTARSLTLDEAVSIAFTLNGKTYSADLTQQFSQAVDESVSIRVDYSAAPAEGALEGSVFAALIRSTDSPGVGALVVMVFDSVLPELLEAYGVTNKTESAGAAVDVPFGLSLTGSVNGTYDSQETVTFSDLYFAQADVLGVGVPPDLAAAAQEAIQGARSES